MLIQYLAIAILIALVIYACHDLKKAILIWLPFKLLFNDQIAVRYESPGMALVIAGDLALIAIYWLKKRKRSAYYQGEFLFKKAFIAFGFSYFISLLFTIAPFQSAAIATIKYFSSGFCMVYLAHKAFKSISDIRLYTKCCVIVSFLIVLLAISENIFQTNVWLDFVAFNSPFDPEEGRMFYIPGHLEIRYGLVRSRSFFSFHIPFGFACVCLYWLLFYFYKNTKVLINSKVLLIASLLLIVGAILSNSKQVYLGLLVMFFSLYSYKTLFHLRIILPVLIVAYWVIIYTPEYMDNILSLTNEELAEEGGGSTIALRESQFDVAMQMFRKSPLIGNGVASIETMKSLGFEGILGAESAWLRILPERGALGAIVYIYMYISLWQFKKHINKKVLFFFLLSIFVIETTGGLKDLSIWGVFLLVVSRYNEFAKS